MGPLTLTDLEMREHFDRHLARLEAELAVLAPRPRRRNHAGIQVGATVLPIQTAAGGGALTLRGVASTAGTRDRVGRVLLEGAWGTAETVCPTLAYHDDTRPVGSSRLIPAGRALRHETRLANTPASHEMAELVRAGGIPGVSIGWVSSEEYSGWRELASLAPHLAGCAEAAGTEKAESITYYAAIEVVELSLVPLLANPLALLEVG